MHWCTPIASACTRLRARACTRKRVHFQDCTLAFMMGSHPRLGENITIAALNHATITNWALL